MTPIDEIKNRLDIVEVVSGYIKLKKAGKDYKALCPFHKEKNPSFFVSPSKQIWHCFSCQNGGDMFSFVMKIEGVEFADALRILAKKAGVVLRKQDPQIQSQRNVLYEVCEEATEFFQKELEKNKSVQEYLKNRGLKPHTISEFKIGFAPNSWDSLYNHLTELGFKEDDIEKAGLLVKKEGTNKYYDRFRSRIMFPISDLNGQIVGFSGRIYVPISKEIEDPRFQTKSEIGSKYVNTPETLIYNKSRIVYGLDKAKLDIRKQNQAVLVEGQMDLIMSHQAGTRNAVAVSGTALTPDHLQILKRYTENLTFCFDADTGGETATKRAIGSAQQFDFNIKIALLPPEKKDPAEIIKENLEQWEKILGKTKPAMDFYFENTFAKYPDKLTVDAKREIAKELLYPIKNIANVVERAHWLQVLASKLKVEEKALNEALRRVEARELGEEILSAPRANRKSRMEELEEHILSLGLKHKKHFDYLVKNLKENLLTRLELRNLFHDFKKEKKLSPDQEYLKNYLIFKAEYCDLDEKEVLPEIESCLREIKANKIKQEMIGISLDIKEAEQKNEKTRLKELTQKFSNLANKLSELRQ